MLVSESPEIIISYHCLVLVIADTEFHSICTHSYTTSAHNVRLVTDKSKTKKKEVDLSELDLSELKLSDEDALALSYLTPGLSRRIQSQLLSQLPTARPSKLSHINEERKVRSKSKSRDTSTAAGITEPAINDRNEYLLHTSEPLTTPNTSVSVDVTDHLSEQDNKNDHHSKYKPYRPCCRSTSLIEPHVNPYRHSYYRNYSAEDYETPKYNHSHSMDSTLPATTGSVTTTSSSRYNRPYISSLLRGDTDTFVTKHTDDDASPSYATSARRVSRFLRPDFYDNCLYSKERKKRELETQKVLKEIRNKRVNENRDKDMVNVNSKRETVESISDTQHNINTNTATNTQPVCSSESHAVAECASGAAAEISTGVVEEKEKKIKRDSRLSKLVRPKSYPAETTNDESITKPSTVLSKTDGTLKSKLFKRSFSSDKSRDSPSKEHKQDSAAADRKKNSSNQLLNSIEKKIRSFYSEQPDDTKSKGESKSRIQSTIRSLREQSEPRGIEHCVTESGLIKRSVSVEDFSTFGSNKQHSKTLQPSRKSVTKILGLFKKYEDKDKSASKSKDTKKSDGTSMKKSKTSSTKSADGSNTKIKTKSDTNGKSSKSSVSTLKSVKNTDNINQYNSTTSHNNDDTSHGLKLFNAKNKPSSKLPVSGLRNSTEDTYKPDRKDLKLNLRNVLNDCKGTNDIPSDDTSSRDEHSVLFSPGDETNDSWSVCSDMQRADMSPNSDNKLLCSEEEANESVSDRIRRKSFYCRFNEKKKPRKSTIVNNTHNPYDYKNYDLKYTDVPPNTNLTKTKSVNNAYATTKDIRPYKRATSASDNLYMYYNPERYQRESSVGHTSSTASLVDKKSSGLDHKSLIAKPRRYISV